MCEAYTQIPSVILVNGADHRDAYPGDGGLRFLARAPKADVEYEPTAAHHERRCELCAHFLPPDHCRRVVGEISAQGWCKLWTMAVRADAVSQSEDDAAAMQTVRILLRADGYELRLMRAANGTESYAVVDLGGRYLWFAATEAEGRRKFQELSGSGRADGIAVRAAGVMIICNGSVLLCRRTDTGEWAFPAGHVEDGETVEEAAARECEEETGFRPEGMLQWTRRVRDGVDFTTFACRVPERFEPVLNAEHDAYEWIDMSDAVELPVGGGDGAPEQVSVT